MADYITLLGAEQVQSAACAMQSAAESMNRAASQITFALEQHQQFMNDFLDHLNAILEDRISDFRQVQP